jgi:hypothetical protein
MFYTKKKPDQQPSKKQETLNFRLHDFTRTGRGVKQLAAVTEEVRLHRTRSRSTG